MSIELPIVYLARHGETEWTLSGKHTGRTDLPLTEARVNARRHLGERLGGALSAKVFREPAAPSAARTCEFAGFGSVAQIDSDLVEWSYGDYEGLTTNEIRAQRPDWQLFRDGCPGGESLLAIGARADRVIARVRAVDGNVLAFSGVPHFSRVLAARWLRLEPAGGKYFVLSTAALSALGYEHTCEEPVIEPWNDDRHVGGPYPERDKMQAARP